MANHQQTQGEVIREVLSSFTEVMRSEASLMRAEVQESVRQAQDKLVRTALFGVLAGLGAFPIISFLVIGLGRLFNDNYWLSSLIVGIVMMVIGGTLAFRALRSIRVTPLNLPETRESLSEESRKFEEKLNRIADSTWRKAA